LHQRRRVAAGSTAPAARVVTRHPACARRLQGISHYLTRWSLGQASSSKTSHRFSDALVRRGFSGSTSRVTSETLSPYSGDRVDPFHAGRCQHQQPARWRHRSTEHAQLCLMCPPELLKLSRHYRRYRRTLSAHRCGHESTLPFAELRFGPASAAPMVRPVQQHPRGMGTATPGWLWSAGSLPGVTHRFGTDAGTITAHLWQLSLWRLFRLNPAVPARRLAAPFLEEVQVEVSKSPPRGQAVECTLLPHPGAHHQRNGNRRPRRPLGSPRWAIIFRDSARSHIKTPGGEGDAEWPPRECQR